MPLIDFLKVNAPGAHDEIWADPVYCGGEFGVFLASWVGEELDFAMFVLESQFSTMREDLRTAPPPFPAVFDSAVERLQEFKTKRAKSGKE
jgi:hypothetical protein